MTEPRPETSSVDSTAVEYARSTAATAGNAVDSLETFVSEHYGRLIRLAGLVCRSVDEAEDAVQSGLERAWRKRDALRDPASLRSWLDRIVVREAIRVKRGRLNTVDGLVLDHQRADATDAMAALRIAFEQLSADQRAAVVLHMYMGYPVATTAEMLGARTETIRSRLRLARERLRHLLAEEG